MRHLTVLLLVLSPLVNAGNIYQWVDENGVTHFGDKPPATANIDTVNFQQSHSNKKRQFDMQPDCERAAKNIIARAKDEYIKPKSPLRGKARVVAGDGANQVQVTSDQCVNDWRNIQKRLAWQCAAKAETFSQVLQCEQQAKLL